MGHGFCFAPFPQYVGIVSNTKFSKDHPAFARICLHCNQRFCPGDRNRHRQMFCQEPACRKASKARSQRLWLAKNPGHFEGHPNVIRVQQWRQAHPGYARRKRAGSTPDALQEPVPPLQDSASHNPLIIGLVAEVCGCVLQENIEKEMRRLIITGMKIMSSAPPTAIGPRNPDA